MNDKLSRPLLLEQLEERIFLDANPLAAAAPDSMVEHAEPVEIAAVEQPVERETTPAAPPVTTAEKEPDGEQTEKTNAETTASTAVPIENSQNGATAETAAGSQPVIVTSSTETSTSDVALAPADLTTSSDATSSGAEPGAGFGSTEAENTSLATSAAATEASDASEQANTTVSTADLDISLTTNSAAESQEPVAPTAIDLAATSADASLTTTTATVESATAIDPMIGEDFTFTVTFDNPNPTSGDTVYGPYIDLVLDRGLEGTEPTNGSWDDGISFQGATYLGQNVQFNSQIVSSTGSITHYWATDATGAPLVITGLNPGDEFVTLLLPFGSFTPDQTPADIVVTAHMSANADVDTALNVDVITGALYGTTALNDPGVDAPLRGSADGLAQTSIAFMPEVIAFNTDIILPDVASDCQQPPHDPFYDDTRSTEANHQEIPTGPNFPGQYVSTIDIAAGQTVGGTSGGIVYTQHIPNSVYYLGNSSITVEDSSGNPLSFTVVSNPTGASGGDLVIQLDNPTVGTSGSDDVVIRYGFYVPEQTGGNTAVIDPTTGDDAHIINDGEVTYRWTPIDSSHDTTVTATIDAEVDEDGNFSDNADVDDISHAEAITIQKDHTLTTDNGAVGYTPGDVLSYTLDFQVSDYFSFGDGSSNGTANFEIVDTIGNGLVGLDAFDDPILAFTTDPVITIYEEGAFVGTLALTAGNQGTLWWATDGTDQGGNPDGSIDVHYDLQAILLAMGNDGILDGGYSSGTAHGATYGTISYQATVNQYYANGYQFLPGAELNIDQGDTIEGGATITGDVYDRDTSSFTGASENDGSCDSIAIVTGGVSKDIVAINGETNPALWDTDASGRPRISPGDTVSYRLTYDMPISSTEDFHLIDYLPLPVFNANDPDLNGTPGGWVQIANPNLDATPANDNPNFDTDIANFDAGEWFFTSQYTYEGTFSSANVDVPNNALDLRWSEYHDIDDSPGKIDLVFTVKVSDAPFADGLFLTNQVTATEQGTLLSNSTTNDIVQIVLDEPVLAITKDAAPVAGIDAGDTVSFSIEVENTGHAGAFDLRINDTLPADYNTTATNFTVTRDGVTLALGTDYTWITGGGVDGAAGTAGDNFFADPGADGTFGTADDGYAGGIELIDRDRDGDGDFDGALAAGETLTITYDLVAATSIEPLQTLVNTATITNYAGANGGPDHTLTDLSDNATVTAATPTVSKVISDTGETSTSENNVVIGETVTYTVTITVPEGTSIPDFTDTLDAGLALVGINSISASAGLSTSIGGGFSAVQSGAIIGSGGGSFSLDFGTLTNSNTNNGTPETITINYTAVVLNTSGNQQNTALNNSAAWQWTENGTPHATTNSAPEVTVQEPQLQVIKDVSNNGTTWVNNGNFDQGDPISYRITVQHGSTSTEDAFDVVFTDNLPGGINWAGASVMVSAGETPTTMDTIVSDGTFSASWDQLSYTNASTSQFTTFIISGGVLGTATAGQTITNTGSVTWESLDSDLGGAISSHNANSYERTGSTSDPGGQANDYTTSDPATITVAGTIDKLQPVPAQYTIGDVVTYDIVVTLPEGTTNNLVVTDELPAGLQYQNSTLITSAGSSNGLLTADFAHTGTLGMTASPASPADGTDISWTITTDGSNIVAVNDDNNTANNSFVIRVTALVTNNSASHGDPDGAGTVTATSLTNHASMSYTGGSATDLSNPVITVIEPQITTIKNVADSADPGSDAQPGEILTYTARFTNTGTSAAYEVTADDQLPTGILFNAGSATVIGSSGVTNAADVNATYNAGLQTLNFTNSDGGWDINVGGWVEIQYTVTVMAAGFTAGPHVNTIDADWSNQNGTTNVNERNYIDGATPYLVDGSLDTDPAQFLTNLTGSLGDTVFFDAQGNGGVFNAAEGDVGITGVRVTLTADVNNDGTFEYTQTVLTNASGQYQFNNLAAFNNYVITVDHDGSASPFSLDAAGYNQTYDLDGTGSGHVASNVSLTTGQHRTDVDFGYTGTQSIGDLVWYDANANGIQEGNEGGLGGITIDLTADIDNDGNYEYRLTTTTATDGSYHFDHLPAGDYTVVMTTPAGVVVTYDQDDLLVTPDGTAEFALPATGGTRTDIDFGLRGTGAIGDTVWLDVDGNGIQAGNATEPGISGVNVTISGDVNNDGLTDYTASTTTDADGLYHFTNLLGGAYTVTVTQPAGMSPTYDLNGIGTPNTAQLTLPSGTTDNTVDFGYRGQNSVGDTIWFDVNANGTQDPGEDGVGGLTVTITADIDGDGISEYTATDITDGSGIYGFSYLPEGSYVVTVTPPASSVMTYDQDSGTTAPNNNTAFTLGADQDRDDIDFGLRGTGSLGDLVWFDVDADGVQDAGEDGIGNVTVTLNGDIDSDGTIDFTTTATTTGAGLYGFSNLLAGTYTVSVTPATLPAGMNQTYDLDGVGTPHTATTILTAGEVDTTVDFGYNGTGSLGDVVWFDVNADGIQDPGEPGITGVAVTLQSDIDGDGTIDYTSTINTDATGNYLFTALPAASYTVSVNPATLPGGMSPTYDLNGTATPNTTPVTLNAGQNRTDVDFGYRGQNSVGDTVWFDVNANGLQDPGEDGVGGLTVTLTADIDGDGVSEYTATDITDGSGIYGFDYLPAGSYVVTVTTPTGSVVTYDQDSGTTAPNNNTAFALDADQDRDDIDFGLRGTGTLGDTVWFDTDADGALQEIGEPGIANVTLVLTGDIDGDGTIDYTATTVTDSAGLYQFSNLLAGNYTITVDQSTLPQGMHQTFDPGGSASLDSTHLQTLPAGGNITTIDFGYTGNGAIGDRVWWDGNNNGFQDAGEPGLSNVQIQLVCDFDGDGTPEVIGTTTTDQNGNYLFSNLPAAAGYVVSVVSGLPSGADPTYDLDNISSPNITTTNLSYNAVTGQVDQNLLVDFGYRGTGTLGDRVWNDLDSGGDQDAGEPGLAGVTVTLTADLDGLAGNGDEFVLSTVTDANGNYNFDGLFTTAGGIDYTITVNTASLPASFSQTYDYDGLASPNTAQATLSDSTPQNLDVDFGYNVSSALGDRVWLDSDGDGVQDAGEHGLAGMTVTLYDHNGVQLAQQTTGSNGQYLFNNLAAGAYTVSVSNLPQGLQQTFDRDGLATANTAAVTIGNQASDLTVDFGYRGTGSIGDRIWNDLDNGGDQDAGEPGLAGVTVTLVGDLNHDGDLLDPEDTLVTTTDASGIYHFDGLFAGNYTVTVTTAPPGMVLTADPQGAMDGSASVTLGGTAPMVTDTVDFGYHQTGTIGDRIWYDLDADGVQDAGELGLNNVTVSLYQDTDNDGVADGSAIATAFTTADGQYLFTNLNAGSYVVIVDPATLPGGMTQTYDPQGALDHQAAVALPANGAVLNIDFGYTGTGSIGDTLWNDLDAGGDQDTGEPGLAGVRVILTGDFNNDGTPDQLTTITDANGTYHFNHLVAGNYTVSVDTSTLPIGMTLTADPQGPADNSALVTLGGGQPMVNNAIDFGYRQSGTIGDTIWYDLDADGTQDAGELGLANIHVILTGDYDGDGDIDTLHQFTDAQGHYFFTGLQAGTYDVIVDTSSLPGGMVQSGDPDAILNNRANVTLATAQSVNLDQDFGYTGTGSIGDTVWYDFDGDGIQDPNEAGIPNVTITLTGDFDNDGQVDDTITAITGPNGQYLFDHLPQGQYLVTVNPADLPGGMVPTGDPDGTPDNQTSLTLAAGQNSLVQDFGYTGTGAIGDTLWNDRNRNGIQDPGETGLAGVTVSIGVDLNGDGNPDFTATTTTDADGRYIFDHLPAGSHTVRVDGATLPRGIRPSYDPDGTLDGSFVVQLGAGEQNLDVDFGYAYPPPVVAKPQPQPFVPPVTPPSEPDGLVIDAFFMHRQFGELERFPFDHFMEISYPQPPLPVSPIYTGMAEPGTTLELSIYDGSGNLVGSQTIMADTGGNWLASFPGSLLHELPHDMLIEQKMALYNESTAGLFNMRTYFNPNFTSLVKTSTILDVDTIFDYLPSTIMDSVHSSLYGGFNIRWNSFNGYEFFATSINPAETGR